MTQTVADLEDCCKKTADELEEEELQETTMAMIKGSLGRKCCSYRMTVHFSGRVLSPVVSAWQTIGTALNVVRYVCNESEKPFNILEKWIEGKGSKPPVMVYGKEVAKYLRQALEKQEKCEFCY